MPAIAERAFVPCQFNGTPPLVGVPSVASPLSCSTGTGERKEDGTRLPLRSLLPRTAVVCLLLLLTCVSCCSTLPPAWLCGGTDGSFCVPFGASFCLVLRCALFGTLPDTAVCSYYVLFCCLGVCVRGGQRIPFCYPLRDADDGAARCLHRAATTYYRAADTTRDAAPRSRVRWRCHHPSFPVYATRLLLGMDTDGGRYAQTYAWWRATPLPRLPAAERHCAG